jgi:electron transfer flavoprotein alpha subunit
MKHHIIIIIEIFADKTPLITFELIGFALALQTQLNLPVKIIASGNNINEQAKDLAEKTGLDVLILSSNETAASPSEIVKVAPDELLYELNPAYICMPHNAFGIEIASGIAIRLNADCITAVEKMTFQNDHIYYRRRIFNDKISEILMSASPITVLTIQPGAFKPIHPANAEKGNVFLRRVYFPPNRTSHMGYKHDMGDTSGLSAAEVIVAAGNGVEKKETLELIYQLASIFSKSSVAGSRPICDKKWLAYNHQVGATGATVNPKLYIACGISGASQHVVGMRDSKLIVAINSDPHAAIFNVADICVIEDLLSFIPLFIDAHHHSEIPK